MKHFEAGIEMEDKSDDSPVTNADREAEVYLSAALEEAFPEDGQMGEEGVAKDSRSGRRWIIDPIDGTKAFVRGVPLWGTLVACCEGETVLAGAVCYPVVDETLAAAVGEGCWWNGTRARVSAVDTLAQATACITDERFPGRPHRAAQWRAVAAECGVVRTWGDCYGYLLLATGRAEVMVDDLMNPWDAAAVLPLVTEAGGAFTDWRGRATAFGGDVIATNAALASLVRGRLHDHPPETL
jgi:histidinol phosphatase-like enzyme (inositol monophosphatase family)